MAKIKFSKVFLLLTVLIAILNASVDAGYLGCYKEKIPIPHFLVNPGAYGKSPLTPQICYTLCGGLNYNYAALGAGIFCRCSNTSPDGNLDRDLSDTKCDMICPGSLDKCGSASFVSVYRTPISVEVILAAAVNTVPSGSQVILATSAEPGDTAFDLRVNFDDGAGRTYYSENGTDLLSRTYHQAGEYEIRSYVTDVGQLLPDRETATYVNVQAVPSNVSITCPVFMATYEEDVCYISVTRGTDMQLQLQYTDGNPGPVITETIQLSDAMEYALGNFVQEHINPTELSSFVSGSSTGGLIVQDENPAQFSGTLVGIEYHGVNTGSLNVYVYSPNCGGQVYCYDTNTCENTCAKSCTGSGGYCTDIGDCCDTQTPRSTSLLPSYALKHTITISVTPGYGFEPAPAGLDISPGDVIAHQGLPTPLIANSNTDVPTGSTFNNYYCNGLVGPVSFTALQCSISSEFHQLKGIYAQPSQALFPLQFTNPGSVTFQADAVSLDQVNIAGSDSSSVTITVLEGVNAAILTVPLYVAATVSTAFSVEPYTGGPTTIDWDFGAGTTGGLDLNPAMFAYPAIGTYNLTVNISNAVSFKFNFTTIIVQEPITGLTINTPSTYLVVGVATNIDVTLATGSDFTCVFDFVYEVGQESITKTWVDGLNFDHTFNTAGPVELAVNCSNNLGSAVTSASYLAVEPLVNVALTPPGARVNQYFNLLLSWDSGTEVTVNSCTYDGQPVTMILDNNLRQAVSENMLMETVTGTHLVSYDISNPISSVSEPAVNFGIEVEITNPFINCTFLNQPTVISNTYFIPINTGVMCEVDMDSGTSVVLTVDFGDGNTSVLAATATEPWSSAKTWFSMPVTHTYTATGYFQLKVTISNAFNSVDKTYPVGVMVRVDNTVMDPVQAVRFGPPAIVNFTFSITGSVPNDVRCTIEWGDGNYDIYEQCDVTDILTHEYLDRDGTLTLTYTLENMVSSKTDTILVYIVTPIINNECYTTKTAASKDEPIGIVFKTWRGPPAGELNLTFVCDIANPGTPITRARLFNGPDAEEIEYCTYTTTGQRTMSIRAVSMLEDKICHHTFEVLNPVKEDFDVYTPNSPSDHGVNVNCDTDYSVVYTGIPPPDAAYVKIEHGDGSVYGPVPFATTVDHSYSYLVAGHFISTIIIYNDASEVKRTVLTGCYDDFSTHEIQVLRTPLLPLNSSDEPGYGNAENMFRADEPLRIHTSLTSGTLVLWEASAVSASNVYSCNSTEDIITMNIGEYGIYQITVTPWNPVHVGTPVTYVAEVMRPMYNLTVSEYNQTSAYENKLFNITADIYGTAMCVAVKFGDIDNEVELFGENSTCSDTTQPEAHFGGVSFKNGIATDVSASFDLQHQYFEEGTFTLEIFAWNAISNETKEHQFVISKIDCSAPKINIRDRAKDFRYPLKYYRSIRIKITGVTAIECPNDYGNTKLWEVFMIDQMTNTVLEKINMTTIDSASNSELAFPPRFLSYGVYLLRYKVTMLAQGNHGEEFSSTAETYIKVIPSKIVVQLMENSISRVTIGPNVLLTFSPKTFSYDPDIDTTIEADLFDEFKLACRDVTLGQEFPETSVEVTALNLTDLPPGHVDDDGCFQQGPGWIKNFDGYLSFLTGILKPDHIYEFECIGRKGTRTGTAYGQVFVKSADPPNFKMDFKIPSLLKPGTGGKYFNPNNQLGMLANMVTPCPACSYQWELFAYDYQFCGPVFGCWRNLAYLMRYIEGTQSQELTVHPPVFEQYFDVELFQLRLTLTDNSTGISGTSSLNLTRNNPPSDGNCTITPANGTALVTNFTIRCYDFVDKEGDEISNYLIKCKSDREVVEVASDIWPNWQNKLLPIGDSTAGYVLKCNVTVTDDQGSAGTYPLQDVEVKPMDTDTFRKMLLNMKESENDLIDLTEAVANLDDASGMVLAMVSMAQELSEQDEVSDCVGLGSSASYVSTGFNNINRTRPSAFVQVSTNETVLKAYEEVRDATAQVLQQCVETLEKVTVESPEETKRLTSTVASVSSSKTFLTRNSQKTLTKLLEKAVKNVQDYVDSMSVETIKEITQSSMDACANIGESAALTKEHPTNSDLNTMRDDVTLFDTNLDSSKEDVKTFDNDEDAMHAGLTIYNAEEQQAFASSNLGKCTDIQDSLIGVLVKKQPKSPKPTVLQSNSFVASIMKNDLKTILNSSVNVAGCSVDLPADAVQGESEDSTFVLSVTVSSAPQISLPGGSVPSPQSRTISVVFSDEQGKRKNIGKLPTPVKLKIAQDPNAPKVNMSGLVLANPEIPATRHEEIFFYHQIEMHSAGAALQLRFRLTDQMPGTQLLVLLNNVEKPELDEKRTKVKSVCMIPSDTSLSCADPHVDDTVPHPCSCFVDADVIGDNIGIWYAAIRQLLPHELNKYKTINDLQTKSPDEWKENKNFTTDYAVVVGEIGCGYMEHGDSTMKTNGVKPSPLSNEDNVVCITTHFTTFAGGWAVAPNTIDWNFVFSNADFFKNPTLYITEIVIAVAYIIAMIWARRKDKQDLEKLGLAPLLDNDPRDKYFYEIMVSTGMRRGAGTESKVHFILSGEEEETDVRTFEDKKRPIFTRGSTSGFLMSVPESLGALSYLRIWHDNSGKGRMASWYLNHVIIRDVQTDKKYYFITNRWFAVEEDDGQVDRVIPVAGKEQMTEFSHLFSETATKNLSDGHLWFSVVARPPQSRFTRCQRVSCCLCLLFTSMLANAMFYGTETSDANAFQFGPFALTSEQIFIGVMSNLIIFPVNFLLITLFRKSRPRKLRPSRVEEAMKSKPERSTSMADVNPRVKSSLDFERPGSSFLMDTKRSQSAMSRPESSMSNTNVPTVDAGKKKKKKCELPWWFTIIAWILLWIAVLVSAAFVTFYGIMFQDIKCKKWITSMLISFFMSVFFTQPIKVFLLAIFLSLVIKNPGGDDDDDDEETPKSKKLESDEEYLHEEDEFGLVAPRKPMYKPKPPDTKSLEAARQQRLKEIQMWAVIREILFYAFFLWILLVISYRNVSTDSYNYKYNMQKVFILTNDTNKAFSKVKNTDDFWTWAKSGMLRGIRAGPYYNFFPAFYMRGYINDKQSRLMGYAVLRQVRTRPNTCRVPRQMEGVIDQCNAAYDIADEEDRDFGPGWTSLPINSTRDEYKYQTASTLNGYPYWGEMALYSGGGYVVKLNKDYLSMINDFDQLKSEGWIDKYTRAVFLEFTVYNPSINLFSVSTLLAEFLPSGGVSTTFRFEPCNLLPYMNSALLFQIICEIVYFAFTVFFVVKEIRYIIKQKKEYFLQFWNLVDLGICAMSVTAIVVYFYRLFCINELTEYFKETNGNEYMKFQYVGYWSEIFNYIIGFLVFFATLKFLKLLRFNRKISMLSDTLRNSSKDLIHFSIIFNIVFLAFIQVFYLVYMSHLDIFKTFISSCEAGIVMMMGKFDIYNMLGVNQWITQVFIFLFVVTVTFIVVNMLLSILNDTFTAVRNDKAKQQNDYEIVDFMLGRFKMWTGIGRGNTTITPSEMEERNQRYRTLEGQIDYFPDQIDRFLASVSNMYMGDAKFEDFLNKGMARKMAIKAQQSDTSHPAPRYPGALRISNGARGMTDVQTD